MIRIGLGMKKKFTRCRVCRQTFVGGISRLLVFPSVSIPTYVSRRGGMYGEKKKKTVRQVAKYPIQNRRVRQAGTTSTAPSVQRVAPISITMHTDHSYKCDGAVVIALHPLSIPHNVTKFLGLSPTALLLHDSVEHIVRATTAERKPYAFQRLFRSTNMRLGRVPFFSRPVKSGPGLPSVRSYLLPN
jgi:hypothetical protein